ncbi:reverse transcriptase family protein [Marinobacter sp. SS13-12]|uniref:reverse transcriptase family protein n=1 Tax=Marinobacter sp. SS13-12 TaxID=3050451 RepID=UPI002552C72F|nr:reverse transcriptase family protein [Marinobacter sp. SS13-12]MDK8465007.1 reverse transcriptase family protein [Marinobacter sp. SS13-12]
MSSSKSPANSLRLRPRGLSPRYRAKRISSGEALEAALQTDIECLRKIASDTGPYHKLHSREGKPDGTVREIFSLKQPLKPILQRVNSHILRNCYYPPYLTGSLSKSREGTPESELRSAEANYLINARRHSGQGTVIRIDATNFFPSIREELVYAVWRDLFLFSEDVSDVLTKLTTYQGGLVQGSPTSSFLANLALWRVEPVIVQQLEKDGIRYSRYVDDIVVSTTCRLSSAQKNKIVRASQKVFLANGLKIKTRKTEVMDRNRQQRVHNVIVNSGRPTAGKERKHLLRSMLHHLRNDLHDPSQTRESIEKRIRSLEGKIREFKKLNRTAGTKYLQELDHIRREGQDPNL